MRITEFSARYAEARLMQAETAAMIAAGLRGDGRNLLEELRRWGPPPPPPEARYGEAVAAQMRRDKEAARHARYIKIKNTLARPGGRKVIDAMCSRMFFRGSKPTGLREMADRAAADLKAEGRLPEE